MAKKTIKRIRTSNKDVETNLATAMRLLREARAHFGAEIAGDMRYVGAEGWDDETLDQWFAEVDQLVGPAFPGGGYVASEQPALAGDSVEEFINDLLGERPVSDR